jgi:hypothetical protein
MEMKAELPADRLRAPLSDPDPQVRTSGPDLAAASADGLQLLVASALDEANDWNEDLRARARGKIFAHAQPWLAVTVAYVLVSRQTDIESYDAERALLTDLVAACGPAGETAVVDHVMEVMQSAHAEAARAAPSSWAGSGQGRFRTPWLRWTTTRRAYPRSKLWAGCGTCGRVRSSFPCCRTTAPRFAGRRRGRSARFAILVPSKG